MPAARTQAILLSESVHSALTRYASTRTLEAGKRVTLRSLVESALYAAYPELRETAAEVAAGQVAADASEQFNTLLGTLYSSGDPVEVNAAIERLEGSVPGSSGQPIRLRELAYHLRGTRAAVGSMRELVADYEGGQAR